MRRITIWLLSTISTLVLLFSYHTSTARPRPRCRRRVRHRRLRLAAPAALRVPPPGPGTDTGTSGSGSVGQRHSSSARRPTPATPSDPVRGRPGPRSPSRTARSRRPRSPRCRGTTQDQEINSFALPVLNAEAVDAQSADIDMVSGRHLHLAGLHRVAAVRDRPGEPVTRRDPCAGGPVAAAAGPPGLGRAGHGHAGQRPRPRRRAPAPTSGRRGPGVRPPAPGRLRAQHLARRQ